MRKLLFVLLFLPIIGFGQQKSPCLDARYVQLKNKQLDEMSDREYKYFLQKDSECSKYMSKKGLEDANESIDISSANWDENYRKRQSYKKRQKFDIIAGGIMFALTAVITTAVDMGGPVPVDDDGMTAPMIFVPVLGPFFVAMQPDVESKYKLPLICSGLIQTAAVTDFFLTREKIRLLDNDKGNLSGSIDLNPFFPSIRLVYNLK